MAKKQNSSDWLSGIALNALDPTIDPATGLPRPVGAPNVPYSTIDPATGAPRPVNPPAYNPQPALQDSNSTWEREQTAADTAYEQWMRGTLNSRTQDEAGWEAAVAPQIAQLPGITAQQNAARVGNTAGLRSAFEGYNASDLAATNDFINTNNANLGIYNTRANELYNTTVPDYVAQTWTSNPQDIANQNQALGQFSSIYGGSLDYQAAQAQAAQAQAVMAQLYQYASDPSDVNRQKEAIAQLKGMINGGEWHDSMAAVRDKFKGLSDPEITAQERFIMEQFNQRRQDIDRSNREAVMSNLAARGLRSGAAEQTAMLNSQQELGRQSVLAGLGAQANAIGRSQQAMQGWAQTATAGRQAELAAMGMYIDAAGNLRSMNDQVGMFNTREANTNSMYNAGQQNETNRYNAGLQTNVNVANAGFTNQARANNQATRLGGAQGYATQANAIRGANDAVGTFNTGQQNLVGMSNQQMQHDELIRKGDVAQGQLFNNTATGQVNLDARKSTNSGNAGRDLIIHGAQQGDIDSYAGGQRGDIAAGVGYEDQKLKNRNDVTDTFGNVGTALYGGVFTPTITAKKKNQDALIGNQFYIDPNRKYG